MRINQLYHNWLMKIMQLRPGERITCIRNLAWMMVGIFESKSVVLNKVAMKIPGVANLLSVTRRMSRFLDNPAIRYGPVAGDWLTAAANTVGEIRLLIGCHPRGLWSSTADGLVGFSSASDTNCLDLGQM